MTGTVKLEELLKDKLNNQGLKNMPDTYAAYTHKGGVNTAKSYSDAMGALYAASKKNLASYGQNNRFLNNKGLQNSGYRDYINDMSKIAFDTGASALRQNYANSEASARESYAGYLESYADKHTSLRKSVMSHLIDNDIVDMNTAIAYGVSAGLSEDEAREIGESAYAITKQKVFNTLLEQSVSLGLDSEGARMLAIKMGISENDAAEFAKEISDMMSYYANVSDDYLAFLEQRANG